MSDQKFSQRFQPGDIVRVRDEGTGELSQPVTVGRLYATSGGLRLEEAVFGFTSWNERDCVPA